MNQETAELLLGVVAAALVAPKGTQANHFCLLPRTPKQRLQYSDALASLGNVGAVEGVSAGAFSAWPLGVVHTTCDGVAATGICPSFAHPLPDQLFWSPLGPVHPRGPAPSEGTWVVDVTATSRFDAFLCEAAKGSCLTEAAGSADLLIGQLSDTCPSGQNPVPHGPSQNAVLTLPGELGSAQTLFLLLVGFERLLETAARNQVPMLLRVHYAALGLARADIRFFEKAASRSIAAFCRETGQPALLLGDFGQVQDYADASVALAPSQACRVDLDVPQGRVRPVLLSILQTAAGAASLEMRLTAPNGTDLVYQTQNPERLATLTMGSNCVTAAIAKSALPDKFGQLALSLGVAADTLSGPIHENWSQAGNWELTIRNTGHAASKLSFVMDDKVPLKSSTAASLRLSRSSHWDAEMLDFVSPVFCDVQTRLAALARHADVLPDFVLRRRSDPLLWPMIAVSQGTSLTHCLQGAAEETPHHFDGFTVNAAQMETVDHDIILGRCLRVLSGSTPAMLQKQLAGAFVVGETL